VLGKGRSAPAASRQVVVLAAVLALLLALLALTTALAGPSRFGDARTGGIIDGPLIRVDQRAQERVEQQDEEQPSARLPRWLPVLLVLLVTFALALAVRALIRAGGGRVEQEDPPLPVGDAEGDPQALVLDDLRTSARAAAGEVRRDAAGTADAVVRCWERLEQHGERLGTPRGPHETPTEYGADLLRRHGADADAVEELLRLYHRARFGRAGLPDGTAARAAEALERVAETLRAPAGTKTTRG